MIRQVLTATVGLALLPAALFAQTPATSATTTPPANPSTQAVKGQFGMVKNVVARSAEKVPEELYAFKPTPEVRSMGQLFGHIADAQFSICAVAAGEKPPQSGIEKSMTSKAQLSKAIADSNAYCDKVIEGLDDKKGMETVEFFRSQTPRLNVLTFNIAHSYEHYGNLVTYMRLKGIVPPSSENNTR
jgi:uncharacterized damage-inducible protein DinB